jgi:two-component system phosphate regulon sensor histidine kinase PhoR
MMEGDGLREDAESLRVEAERAVSLEKVKSDFLKLASHELRGPLALIRGYISMMGDGSMGELPPALRQVIPILSGKATQMAMLLEQMLEASRLEDGALSLEIAPVDLGLAMRQVVEALGMLTMPNQTLRLTASGQPVIVMADPARVETILLNLLDNAIKYSPGGGEIQVLVEGRDGRGLVSVKDPGLGIAPDHLAGIFDRFGRVVTPENSHIPGTGLGLYLSRDIAQRLGGDIAVTSAVGMGSTFTLSLPLVEGSPD